MSTAGQGSARTEGPSWQGSTLPCQGPSCRCRWSAASPGIVAPKCPECGDRQARPPWCICQGRGCMCVGGCSLREEGVSAVDGAGVRWCVE